MIFWAVFLSSAKRILPHNTISIPSPPVLMTSTGFPSRKPMEASLARTSPTPMISLMVIFSPSLPVVKGANLLLRAGELEQLPEINISCTTAWHRGSLGTPSSDGSNSSLTESKSRSMSRSNIVLMPLFQFPFSTYGPLSFSYFF